MISPSNREQFIDCPVCGKPAASKDCSYNARGWHCFVCGGGGSLADLAEKLGQTDKPLPRVAKTKREPAWLADADTIQADYVYQPGRVEMWRSYKPLRPVTMDEFGLGLGVLDQYERYKYHTSRCSHYRLTYPVYQDGKIVAFRGRAIGTPCCGDSWMSMAGSKVALWMPPTMPHRPLVLVVCENAVDAMLAIQAGTWAVAGTGGAGTWRPEWTQTIARLSPGQVVVWYDNDLAGCPNPETYQAETARWLTSMQEKVRAGTLRQVPPLPQPNGPKVANALLAAGLHVTCHLWPRGTPKGYDLGALIADG